MYTLFTVSLALSTSAHPFITARSLPPESAWMTILLPPSATTPVVPPAAPSSKPVGQPIPPPAPTSHISPTLPSFVLASTFTPLSNIATPGVPVATTHTIPAATTSSVVSVVPTPSSSPDSPANPSPSRDSGVGPMLHAQICSTDDKCENIALLPYECRLLTTTL